jgi:hypothetical protein
VLRGELRIQGTEARLEARHVSGFDFGKRNKS